VTFGGFKEDFMLVVQEENSASDVEATNRHLFAMPPGRVSRSYYFDLVLITSGLTKSIYILHFAYKKQLFS